jgi:hypothetical protein
LAISDPGEVRAHLLAAARAGHPLTYAELLAQLGHGFTRPKMRALCKTLSAVDDDARSRGEPELAVLVVRQSDGLPGQGWWVGGCPAEHGYAGPWEGPAAMQFVASLQRAAFAYWAMAKTGAPG